ncbi:MAG TPA: alpha-ketoglutarate-dependent dioxygenase AlkB [Nitrososphaeraceae archaeon]|jgi:alkylated DNA repair dioxygenase AlkB|nr:alpha-ketoglutarate-dependent dioxygenase AlkB [Nitrososphaeraceae archaeon]
MERWLYNQDRIISNILPKDGTVNYYGKILTLKEANQYLDLLLQNILWQNDEAVIFGKHIITKRKTAWYGNSDYLYTYSNTTKQALAWTRELSDLKQIVEKKVETKFNSCLLNLYHDGNEGVGWHSDDEKSLGKNAIIASLSFGAERKFSFKHKQTKKTVSLVLEHGSLLVMKDVTQANWLHSLPKSKKITRPRISLTFRTIV